MGDIGLASLVNPHRTNYYLRAAPGKNTNHTPEPAMRGPI